MGRSPSPSRRRDESKRDRERERDRERDRRRHRSRERERSRSRDRRRRTPERRRRTRSRSTSTERPSASGTKPQRATLPERPAITQADLEGKTPEEQEMIRIMGFSEFDTTKGKKVDNNDVGEVQVVLKRKYRQYMNRKGGFNRPLDFVA